MFLQDLILFLFLEEDKITYLHLWAYGLPIWSFYPFLK